MTEPLKCKPNIKREIILSSLTLRAFSRYILYRSSIALMSSSFFFRAALSSSSFKAKRWKSKCCDVTCIVPCCWQIWIYYSRSFKGGIMMAKSDKTLTGLSVVRLKVLQQLFLLHDFILGLIQLDPEETNSCFFTSIYWRKLKFILNLSLYLYHWTKINTYMCASSFRFRFDWKRKIKQI